MNTSDSRSAAPEAAPIPADSHGAIDLSARATAPTREDTPTAPPAGEGLHLPLITSIGEADFEGVLSTSQTVPVVLVMWSSRSLESKPTLAMLEAITREQAGVFQLVEIDIDQAPQIAQAFQIQAVPTVVALVGGRPVPLFQGSAAKEQVLPVIAQVLEAAAQMGVTARIAVAAADTVAPIPPEHEAPLSAEAEGRLDEAIAGWEKVIELNPRDEAAKVYLSRVRLAARSADADRSDPAARADALFAAGDAAGAFDALLDLIGSATDDRERDALRLRLLDLFRVAGSTPEVTKARTRLAMLLM
ncbi:thioredoxin [Schaalia meyeri]|uniref:tetratricopeptide repeat protein n=1 Tax=Schaalia meyeri TaxID=52773 RepID=UPI000683254B|nr:tetratricopeptide repeat protein [Schaalia meyeri]AKU65050.1 thioredoxin [Schaalia meyeri]